MKNMPLHIVDVFAETKYSGNQLAVFRNAADLSDAEMQQIAKEMHYSETTFILSDEQKNGGYDVRIFTPEEEIPFAGHPTLGTAYVIQQRIIQKSVPTVNLNLKVGQIPVKITYKNNKIKNLIMHQKQPEFGHTFDTTALANVLSLTENQIDETFPIQTVSTGLPFIIVPLKDLNAVKNAEINRKLYFDLIKNEKAKNILIFSPETLHPENNLHVRVFALYYGVPEDPATGSGNGCLAGYLVKHQYFQRSQIDIRVEQGYQLGRPSLLLLKAKKTDKTIAVHVGGKVIATVKGKLL